MSSTKGTVILTGANGTLGLPTSEELLRNYPEYHVIFTVRNDSEEDPNTAKLYRLVKNYGSKNAEIKALDLGSLAAVREFTTSTSSRVHSGQIPPISAILCNAFAWDLRGLSFTSDGNELTFQVSHLSHFLMVLGLLGSMNEQEGKVMMFSSAFHDETAKGALSPIPPSIPNPEDIDELVKPNPDPANSNPFHNGFTRYMRAKLCNVMFAHELNRRLAEDRSLKNITVVALDPGGMTGTRAFDQAPFLMRFFLQYVLATLAHITKYFSSFSTPKDSAWELLKIALGPEGAGKKGYFVGLAPGTSGPQSNDRELQERVWKACVKWCGMKQSDTKLANLE